MKSLIRHFLKSIFIIIFCLINFAIVPQKTNLTWTLFLAFYSTLNKIRKIKNITQRHAQLCRCQFLLVRVYFCGELLICFVYCEKYIIKVGTWQAYFLMQTRFMGISHGSSRQHVTVWSIFGHGRCPGFGPEAVHGVGCSHQHPLLFGPGTSGTGRVTEQMITGNRIFFFLFHSGS